MASPIASPLGPLHLAHPADQARPLRTLISLFRRSRMASNSANSKAKSISSPRRLEKAATLDYHFVEARGNTYTPQTAVPSPPPPPYFVAVGQEEDLVCLEIDEVVQQEKEGQDELAKQRQELLEQDRRMGEELAHLGF